MAKADISKILDRIREGEKVTKEDLDLVSQAAIFLGYDFMIEAWRAVTNLTPGTQDFIAFKKCFNSMSDYLHQYGFLRLSDIQEIQHEIEVREK